VNGIPPARLLDGELPKQRGGALRMRRGEGG
jgi:hypothetical protein